MSIIYIFIVSCILAEVTPLTIALSRVLYVQCYTFTHQVALPGTIPVQCCNWPQQHLREAHLQVYTPTEMITHAVASIHVHYLLRCG